MDANCRAVAYAIELGKNKIPDFDCLAGVKRVVDFTARTANAIGTLARCRCWPEIFVFFEAADAGGRKPNLLVPNLKRFIVIFVYGDGQIEPDRCPSHFLSVRNSQAQATASFLK